MAPRHHDHRPLAVAAACVLAGVAALLLAFSQHPSNAPSARVAPPRIVSTAQTPSPLAVAAPRRAQPVASPLAAIRAAWRQALAANESAQVPETWVAGYYPLYARAQRAYGVNWLLLASVHRQETAFSTAPTTYHGRNFAGCCAGPMQFNVTNGTDRSDSTWERFRGAFRAAHRPRSYPHPTARHPSVYDDFDALMAAAHLLSYEGATTALDGAAWRAAYDYYGHDLTGVGYADEVLARAIGWSQHGFAVNGQVDPAMRDAVEAAWGAPVRAQLLADAA